MMTGVVVAPSLGGLLVGCVLLLTERVLVVVVAPTVLVGCVLLTGTVPVLWTGGVSVVVIVPRVLGGVVSSGIDAMDRKYTI